MTHVVKKSLFRRAAAVGFVAACAAGGQASAQTMATNSAEFNGGWGRFPGQENHPIDVSTRDANGNRVIVDGLILDGSSDTFTQTDNSGAGGVYSGAGGRTDGERGQAQQALFHIVRHQGASRCLADLSNGHASGRAALA